MTSDAHIGLRIPSELEQAVRLLGEREDRTFSAEVRRALWRHVELEAGTKGSIGEGGSDGSD